MELKRQPYVMECLLRGNHNIKEEILSSELGGSDVPTIIDDKAVFIGVSGFFSLHFQLGRGQEWQFWLNTATFLDFGKEEVINFLFLVSALQINGTQWLCLNVTEEGITPS